ncbi:MAG: peptidylprolyl isomerase [Deltaproteobacteria bacterium]|nr:peptidylprolyl isomerase [Deltaproteobacteria bacterium]
MHFHRRTWISTALAALVFCFLHGSVTAQEGAPSPEEDVIAVVNGETISKGQVDRELSGYQQKMMREGKSLTPESLVGVREQIIESLVDRALLHQASVKEGVSVSAEDVQEEWNKIRERFTSEEAFQTALKRMGMTEQDVREEIERGEAVQKFIRQRFGKSAEISEEEARTFYDSHPEAFVRPEQVHARHILIRPDPEGGEATDKDAVKKLQEIRKEAESGEDFAELAKEHSQGPSSERGGDLGYFPRGKMAKPFEDAAFALKPGDMSDVVKTRFGYHLIKLEDRKPEGTVPFEEVQDAVQNYLGTEAVKEAVQSYVKQLRQEAVIQRPEADEKSG